MKLPKFNQMGFGLHAILPVLVVGIVTVIGVHLLTTSHALVVSGSGSGYVNGHIFSGRYQMNPSGSGFGGFSPPSDFSGNFSNRSFDGTQIAYFVNNSSKHAIKIGTLSKGSVINISTIASSTCHYTCENPDAPLVWSPDGTKVAGSFSYSDGTSYIWIARTDGSGGHAIEPYDYNNSRYVAFTIIGWLPGSQNLMYIRQDHIYGDPDKLCMISASGTSQGCHSLNLGSGFLPGAVLAVSPTGGKVVLSAYTRSGNSIVSNAIYTVNSDGSNPQSIVSYPSSLAPYEIVWSPDGTKIAYLLGSTASKTQSSAGLWVMDANGSSKNQINTQIFPASLSWGHQ